MLTRFGVFNFKWPEEGLGSWNKIKPSFSPPSPLRHISLNHADRRSSLRHLNLNAPHEQCPFWWNREFQRAPVKVQKKAQLYWIVFGIVNKVPISYTSNLVDPMLKFHEETHRNGSSQPRSRLRTGEIRSSLPQKNGSQEKWKEIDCKLDRFGQVFP